MQLNFNEEELREQIIEAAANKIVYGDHDYESGIKQRIRNMMAEALNEAVAKQFEEVVAPLLSERVEGLIIQETNRWGEKTGQPLTFT